MELVVFDLDGTLLNSDSVISTYTRDTLRLLAERDVAYTVATGRTLHASRAIIAGHGFDLPHIYKNGVMIWHPESLHFSHRNLLTVPELQKVVQACLMQKLTPFVFTLEGNDKHAVYHPPLLNEIEQRLADNYVHASDLRVEPISELPDDAQITNVSAIGPPPAIRQVISIVEGVDHLVAYSGTAFDHENLHWLDIHHSNASKGGAIEVLKEMLGFERVICFGDNDNDLSMFALADESYAPSNANECVQLAATSVIGHHDEEGIARFLRERFSLSSPAARKKT